MGKVEVHIYLVCPDSLRDKLINALGLFASHKLKLALELSPLRFLKRGRSVWLKLKLNN